MRGPIERSVVVPGSKSLANRALVIAGLVGECRISGVPDGDDCRAMVDGLRVLGADVEFDADVVRVRRGIDRERLAPLTVDAGLAGTTSRFMIGLSALIAGTTTVTGGEALRRRPMIDLLSALENLGAVVSSDGGRLPVATSRGSIRGGAVSVPGDVSSQFVSALMMIGPCLRGGLSIQVVGDVVSRSYLSLTATVMSHFGVNPAVTSTQISIQESTYVARDYAVPADASSASYPLALVALHGGSMRIPRLRLSHEQGDYRMLEMLNASGCAVIEDGDDVVVRRDPAVALEALDVDMRDCSDLVPTIAVLASQITGTSRIRGVGFVRNKESDRIGDLAHELRALGAVVRETADGLEIEGGALHGGDVRTHHDHRLAMAFGVLGTVVDGVSLDDATVVSKSWPDFWESMGIATSS